MKVSVGDKIAEHYVLIELARNIAVCIGCSD